MGRRSVRVLGIVWLGLLLAAVLGPAGLASAADPALPTAFVDTDTIPPVTGSTFTVNSGGNIQAAINSAAGANGNLTHEVVIQAGATFTISGTLTLPVKSAGSGWIIVRTSNLAGIAAQKQRIVSALHAGAMPKLQVSGKPYGVETSAGANHYRFIGLEIIQAGTGVGNALNIWNQAGSTLASIPTDIIIDRCIIRTTGTTLFLVSFQTVRGAIIDSELHNNNPSSGDATAIWMFNTPGPMKVVNNSLLSQGITVMMGAATYVPGYRPQNLEIRRNRIRGNADGGTMGKNLMEWKGGQRIWVQGNLFEDDSTQGQPPTIQMTPRSQSEAATDYIDDITFEYNLLRRVKTVFSLSGRDAGETTPMSRVAIRHNYVYDADQLAGDAFVMGNGTDQVTFDHNTIVRNIGDWVTFNSTVPPTETNWIARNNIASGDAKSAGVGPFVFGTAALSTSAPGRVFSKNVLLGATAIYSGTDLSQNFFPGSISLNADGSLPAGSPYENQATDGTDIGADFTVLYGTASGVGKFGSGPDDFYAITGAWPLGAPDTAPPTAPTSVTATPISGSQIDLAWTASTDNVGVTRYRIERCQGASCSSFSEIATTSVTSASDTGLSASTSYSYRVRAEDAAGNLSPYSATATAVTSAADTTPPTVSLTSPTSGQTLSATVTMAASASDNVGVTRLDYLVDAQVAAVTSPPAFTFAWDTTTVGNGSHALSARAYDATGNVGTSASVTVTVTNATPVPIINVNPPSIAFSGLAGGSSPAPQSFQITNAGAGTLSWTTFDSSLWFNAAPTSGTNTGTVTLTPNTSGLAAGTYSQTITVSAAGATSVVVPVTLTLTSGSSPAPTLNSLAPSNRTAGGAGFTLTATGSNFVAGSVVRWNGANRTTTFVSATQLTAAIGVADIATAGTASVTVFTPAPGGGTSGAQTFTINNPLPTTSSLSPASATAGGAAFTLAVNGSNFVSGSVVRWNGANRTTTFVSATQLTASISAADIAAAGTASVTVFSLAPGGGTSGAQTFTINAASNPSPTLSSVSPTSATAGGAAFTLTVNGSNFVAGSVVRWNGANRTTTFVSSTQLTAAIGAGDIATAGTASVTVFTPAPGGGTSGPLSFSINSANPFAPRSPTSLRAN